MGNWNLSEKNIWVAAHRGWSKKYPENTLLSFKEAIGLGVDQLELDVRVTKDNELVVIHDATVDRTTNGTGKVCEMTLAELKELDAGNGEKIPTLRELMELVKAYNALKRKEANRYQVSKKENKKKKAKRRMAKKSKR